MALAIFSSDNRTSASGRKLPLKLGLFGIPERPLLVKADIRELALENSLPSGRYTPESSR
jgi:hypothetical protein